MTFIPTADLIAKPILGYVWDINTMAWVKETQPLIAGGTFVATIADGADVTEGAIADAASVDGATGTLSAKLRNISSNVGHYTMALDFDVSNNPIYVGKAPQGSAKTAAAWQIQKLTFDGSNNVTDIQYANGSTTFNAIWNNRVGLAYS